MAAAGEAVTGRQPRRGEAVTRGPGLGGRGPGGGLGAQGDGRGGLGLSGRGRNARRGRRGLGGCGGADAGRRPRRVRGPRAGWGCGRGRVAERFGPASHGVGWCWDGIAARPESDCDLPHDKIALRRYPALIPRNMGHEGTICDSVLHCRDANGPGPMNSGKPGTAKASAMTAGKPPHPAASIPGQAGACGVMRAGPSTYGG
jgi:hypothetical protein